MSEDDKDAGEAKQAKQKALQEKQLGNAAYKAKRFDEAIKHYDAAIALDDTDISFLSNRCAPTGSGPQPCGLGPRAL